MRRLGTRTLMAGVIFALVPGLSLAWWTPDWGYRKTLEIQASPAAAGAEEFPVLVRLDAGNFPYFKDTKPDGSDLRFVAGDDKTPLAFHIESYDPKAGLAYVWVKVPRLPSAAADKIFMYYGNDRAPAASESKSTYDVSQVVAYHFEAPKPEDRTGYGNNPAEGTALPNGSSVIGAGVRFGGEQRITIPSSPSLRFVPVQGLTVSVWINLDGEQRDAVIFQGADPAGARLTVAVDGLSPYLSYGTGATIVRTPAGTRLTPGSWQLLAATFAADKATLYLDGQPVGEISGSAAQVAGSFHVGASAEGSRYLAGQLDELNVATTIRSPGWLKAQFDNQGRDDKLVKYAEDAQRDGNAKPSYFLITLQNVTVDGWVVIGMLMLMAVMSWIIMIAKSLTIHSVRKDNAQFIEEFRGTSIRDPAALDRDEGAQEKELASHQFLEAVMGEHDHYQSSTLYHLYHTGIQEMRRRLAGAVVGADRAQKISRESMDAIRATIDAANVRETQKLNSQMVLLTLAIAGGPFLGLLGTVVGVMITFAVIAATGDVNVNSIAPGIAAALVATVAGLSVAIPALFGYNYLASRIKEIVADDRVFIDEFTTKLAEHYS